MIYELSKQHAKLFPLADLNGQLTKYDEEMEELNKAKSKAKQTIELADCYICCAGMYRFDKEIAENNLAIIQLMAETLGIDWLDILKTAVKKWEVNIKRKWEYKDGKYHHIGIDGFE